MILLLILAGCLQRKPPAVFSEPVPPMNPPDLVELPGPTDDACPKAVAYVPGRVPPFVADGLVSCRAQLIPEHKVWAWLREEELAPYWEARALTCQRYREADRMFCTTIADARWRDGEALRTELRWRRAATGAGIVAGVIVGVAVGSVLP